MTYTGESHMTQHAKQKRKTALSVLKQKRLEQEGYQVRKQEEIRIAVMMTDYGDYHQTLLDSYKKEVRKLMPKGTKIVYKEFCSQGPYDELVVDYAREIIEKEFDLVYAIGFRQVRLVKEVKKALASKIPVMFAGVYHAVKKNILRSYKVSQNNIFGVSVESPSNILPAQLIMIGSPDIKEFFMPYRNDGMKSVLSAELDDMCEYFEECGRKIVRRCYTDEELASVLSEMRDYQGVILPEGGITFTERDMFLESVKAFQKQGHDITAFADGKDAIEKGAVYGMRTDVAHVGRLNALQTKHLFVDRTPAHKIESFELTCPRSLVFNVSKKSVSRFGTVFVRDIVALAQDAVHTNQPIPDFYTFLKIFSSYSEVDTPLLRTVLDFITAKVKTRLSKVTEKTFPLDMSPLDDLETHKTPMKESIAQMVSREHQQKLYVAGARAVAETARQIAAAGRKLDLESVQVAPSLEEAWGADIDLGNNSVHHGRVFKPIEPLAIVRTMKRCVERCVRAYAIVGLPEEHLPPGTKEYLEKMVADTAEHLKVKTIVFGSTDIDEIMTFIRRHAKSTRNVFFSFPHLIDSALLDEIAHLTRKEGIMFGVPSLEYEGHAPVAFGLADEPDDFVVEQRKKLSNGGSLDLISPVSSYLFHVSKALVRAFGGIVVPEKLELLPFRFKVDGKSL